MTISFCFSNFEISRGILKAIEDMGFEEPTPIQISAIPPILAGKDVTGQAQTGTGKTAAFGIPTLEKIDTRNRATQAIVLSPTRELAIQTAEEFSRLASHLRGITTLPIYGGQPIERQLKALRRGAQVVVGTPGRVLDHIKRGTLSLSEVTMVILDEADQMLDMGFIGDIEKIIAKTSSKRQTILFSATLPRPILEISKKFQKNPEFVRIAEREMTVPQVEQLYVEIRSRDKLDILCRLFDIYDPALALVFCNTKKGVDILSTHLQARGYVAKGLHGDMKQAQRDYVMANFRNGQIDVLIATDVAARGIDVGDIDLVVNFDVPQDVENYVHRIGRTARAGRAGRAITFVDPREVYKLRAIQKHARINIARIPLPKASDAAETRTRNLMEKVKQIVDNGDIEKEVELIERMMVDDYTSLEIAAALLKVELAQ